MRRRLFGSSRGQQPCLRHRRTLAAVSASICLGLASVLLGPTSFIKAQALPELDTTDPDGCTVFEDGSSRCDSGETFPEGSFAFNPAEEEVLGEPEILRAAAPEWLTQPLLDRALSGEIVEVPSDITPPRVLTTGISPGSMMAWPYTCTMNFFFRTLNPHPQHNGLIASIRPDFTGDEEPGTLWMGTAGHCTDHLDQDIVLNIIHPVTLKNVLVNIGKVKARIDDGPLDGDFAAVALRTEVFWLLEHTLPYYATGICGVVEAPGLYDVYWFGQAVGLPRAGVTRPDQWGPVAYAFTSAGYPGDSGSPTYVLLSGSLGEPRAFALGNVTHLRFPSTDPMDAGSVLYGTRVDKMLEILATAANPTGRAGTGRKITAEVLRDFRRCPT